MKNLFDVRRLQRDVARAIGQIERAKRDVPRAINRGLANELETWLKAAKENAPVDTGALRESGRLVEKRSPSGVAFQIVFGDVVSKGKFVNYALTVHETHPTGSKFLETVVSERAKRLEEVTAGAVERAIKKI